MIAIVHPATAPLSGDVDPPSSKNYTTRYILASCLAEGRSLVQKPAVQDDAVALVGCCRQLGARIVARAASGEEIDFVVENATRVDRLEIEGFGPNPRLADGEVVDTENAGAVLRFLLGVGALVEGGARFATARFAHSLGTRPNRDLLDALEQLGVATDSQGETGMLPIALDGGRDRIRRHVEGRRIAERLGPDRPAVVRISGAVSSQFLSSLLFMVPLLDEAIEVRVVGELKSKPLIHTTLAVLADAGIAVEASADLIRFVVRPGQRYRARTWAVNGDWPGTAAILGAAAVVPNSRIRLARLREDEQGERRCLDFYRAMGCTAESDGDMLTFASPAELRGASIDGDSCTDAVLAMMGAAALGDGESVFSGIENLQFKECDRVREPIAEMRKVFHGAVDAIPEAEWCPDDNPREIRIAGAPRGFEGGIAVDGRGDHRVIMMLSILGLRCRKGLRIEGAHHVAKSFPGWFAVLRAMGAKVELSPEN